MSTEDTVRQYLKYLEDPATLVDQNVVDKLEAKVAKAKDPIDKLRALAELERAKAFDGSELEEAFIREARAWADSENITLGAFRKMGVPDDILARARFDELQRRGRQRRSSSSSNNSRSGRGRSTSADEVQAWVLATKDSFTLADVQRAVGGSPATIKKAVDELTASGRLTNLGPMPSHAGRGRAPYHYALAN